MPDPSSGAGFPPIIERVIDVASGTVTVERQHDMIGLYIDTLDMSAMISLTPDESGQVADVLKEFAAQAKNEQLKAALAKIKAEVCGDKHPNWTDTVAATETRMRIADICDFALANT